MSNYKNSLFEDGFGSNEADERDENTLQNPDGPDALWLFTDDEGKPLSGVMRGESADHRGKAYQTFTLHKPDSADDAERAKQNGLSYRDSIYRPGHLTNAERSARGIPAGQHPVYRAKEVAALPPGETALCVEGELVAEACWRVGVPATTVFGTATKERQQYWGEALSQKEAVICPDLDNGGLRRGREVLKAIDNLGSAKPLSASVMRLDWVMPDAERSFDINDFLSQKAAQLDEAKDEGDKPEWHEDTETHLMRWQRLNSPPVPQDYRSHLTDLFKGTISEADSLAPGYGPVRYGARPIFSSTDSPIEALKYEELHADDQWLIDYLGSELRKAIGRTQDAASWALWSENIMIVLKEMAPGGRLHGWFRMSHGSKGTPVLARKINEGGRGQALKEYSLKDAKDEFNNIKGVKRLGGANGETEYPVNAVEWAWANDVFPHYVEQDFRPGEADVFDTKDGPKVNSYVAPHDAPPMVEDPIPFQVHPLVHILKVHTDSERDVECQMSHFAYAVQNPAGPIGWGTIWVTPPGGGKGTWHVVMEHCVDGDKGHLAYLSIDNLSKSNFTEDLIDKVFVIVDEGSNAQGSQLVSLKSMTKMTLTSSSFTFSKKHVSSQGARKNHCKWCVFANSPDAAKIIDGGKNDRRWYYTQSKLNKREDVIKAFKVSWWAEAHPDIYAEALEKAPRRQDLGLGWFDVMYYWLHNMNGLEDCRHLLLNYEIKYGKGDAPHSVTQHKAEDAGMPDWCVILKDAAEAQNFPFAGDVISVDLARRYLENVGSIVPSPITLAKGLSEHLGYEFDARPRVSEEVADLMNSFEGSRSNVSFKRGDKYKFRSKNPDHQVDLQGAAVDWLEAQQKAISEGLAEVSSVKPTVTIRDHVTH